MSVGEEIRVIGYDNHDRSQNYAEFLKGTPAHFFQQAVEFVLRTEAEHGEQPNCGVGSDDEEADDYNYPEDQSAENAFFQSEIVAWLARKTGFNVELFAGSAESPFAFMKRANGFLEVGFGKVRPTGACEVEFRVSALH